MRRFALPQGRFLRRQRRSRGSHHKDAAGHITWDRQSYFAMTKSALRQYLPATLASRESSSAISRSPFLPGRLISSTPYQSSTLFRLRSPHLGILEASWIRVDRVGRLGCSVLLNHRRITRKQHLWALSSARQPDSCIGKAHEGLQTEVWHSRRWKCLRNTSRRLGHLGRLRHHGYRRY